MKIIPKKPIEKHNALKYTSLFCSILSALCIISILLLLVLGILYGLPKVFGWDYAISDSQLFQALAKFIYVIFVIFIIFGGWMILIIGIITSFTYLTKLRNQNSPLKLARTMLVLNIAGLITCPLAIVIVVIIYMFGCSPQC